MRRLSLSLLLLVGSAGQAHAQSPAPTDTPLLAEGADAAAITDWKARYLKPGRYVEATTDEKRVTLFLPSSIVVGKERTISATFRSELFRPRFADGHWLHSIRKELQIDCAALRYREIRLFGFAQSNMKGPVPTLQPADKWIGPFTSESSAGAGLAAACKRANQ